MKKFPTLAFILLVVGVLWLLSDLNIIADVPWMPLALIAVALGMVYNRFFCYRNV